MSSPELEEGLKRLDTAPELGMRIWEVMQSKGTTGKELGAKLSPRWGVSQNRATKCVYDCTSGHYIMSHRGVDMDRVADVLAELGIDEADPLVAAINEFNPQFTYSPGAIREMPHGGGGLGQCPEQENLEGIVQKEALIGTRLKKIMNSKRRTVKVEASRLHKAWKVALPTAAAYINGYRQGLIPSKFDLEMVAMLLADLGVGEGDTLIAQIKELNPEFRYNLSGEEGKNKPTVTTYQQLLPQNPYLMEGNAATARISPQTQQGRVSPASYRQQIPSLPPPQRQAPPQTRPHARDLECRVRAEAAVQLPEMPPPEKLKPFVVVDGHHTLPGQDYYEGDFIEHYMGGVGMVVASRPLEGQIQPQYAIMVKFYKKPEWAFFQADDKNRDTVELQVKPLTVTPSFRT